MLEVDFTQLQDQEMSNIEYFENSIITTDFVCFNAW